jgi:hypothetical protein
MKNGEQPIHPQTPESWSANMSGLTKREHFAAMAMQGIMANENFIPNKESWEYAATTAAVSSADALLKALEENQDE